MESPYRSIFKVNQHLLMLSKPLLQAYAIVCAANLSISINGVCLFFTFIFPTICLGRPTGQAFVRFKDAEQGEKALERNKCVSPKSVYVFPFMHGFVECVSPLNVYGDEVAIDHSSLPLETKASCIRQLAEAQLGFFLSL